MAGKYVDKFGIEVEGAWTDVPSLSLFSEETDPSIEASEGFNREMVSRPIEYNSNHQYDLWNQLKTLYEYKAEINSSMGLHVHVSTVKDGYYPFLTNEKFARYFTKYVADNLYKFKGKNKKRLTRRLRTSRASSNDPHYFCQSYHEPKDLTKNLQGMGRYKKVNFTNVGRRKNTIEFRVFPAMENVSGIKKAYKIATGAINSFLQYERPPVEIESRTGVESNSMESIEVEPNLIV